MTSNKQQSYHIVGIRSKTRKLNSRKARAGCNALKWSSNTFSGLKTFSYRWTWQWYRNKCKIIIYFHEKLANTFHIHKITFILKKVLLTPLRVSEEWVKECLSVSPITWMMGIQNIIYQEMQKITFNNTLI